MGITLLTDFDLENEDNIKSRSSIIKQSNSLRLSGLNISIDELNFNAKTTNKHAYLIK